MIKLIYVENFLAQWNNPYLKNLFYKLIDFQINGFHTVYGGKNIPIGSVDFICDHYLLVNESEDIVSSFKIMKKSTSEIYKQKWAFNILLDSFELTASMIDYKKALQKFYESDTELNDIFYPFGWTLSKQYRGNTQMSRVAKDMIIMAGYDYSKKNRIKKGLVVGMETVKTVQIFEKAGFKKLKLNEQELPGITSPMFQNQNVFILTSENLHTEENKLRYERFNSKVDNIIYHFIPEKVKKVA